MREPRAYFTTQMNTNWSSLEAVSLNLTQAKDSLLINMLPPSANASWLLTFSKQEMVEEAEKYKSKNALENYAYGKRNTLN
ncbi:hypothetical protein V6N12_015998 [Hibiscus sabdariffa]|uniref:Uncharacterized protein n=1 Tax=Hibiscus sabdariffa TaxID=183260 RepID=A0ABR2DPS9_9ROSI